MHGEHPVLGGAGPHYVGHRRVRVRVKSLHHRHELSYRHVLPQRHPYLGVREHGWLVTDVPHKEGESCGGRQRWPTVVSGGQYHVMYLQNRRALLVNIM